MKISIAGSTHVGNHRKGNEDSFRFLVVDPHPLAIVADGMGGHEAGEVASTTAVDVLSTALAAHQRKAATRADLAAAEKALADAMSAANAAVYKLAQQGQVHGRPGTTCVAAWFVDKNRVLLANVGDSRCYRLRAGKLEQLTVDHSMFEAMRQQNPEARLDPAYKNVILEALGLTETPQVDLWERTIRPGDVFMLCSDGLSNEVSDAEICEILVQTHTKPARAAAAALVAAAVAPGKGHDNVTCVVVKVR